METCYSPSLCLHPPPQGAHCRAGQRSWKGAGGGSVTHHRRDPSWTRLAWRPRRPLQSRESVGWKQAVMISPWGKRLAAGADPKLHQLRPLPEILLSFLLLHMSFGQKDLCPHQRPGRPEHTRPSRVHRMVHLGLCEGREWELQAEAKHREQRPERTNY